MDKKEYLLDGNPASARDLINYARRNYDYGKGEFLLRSSEASAVLRQNGHSVEDNTEVTE